MAPTPTLPPAPHLLTDGCPFADISYCQPGKHRWPAYGGGDNHANIFETVSRPITPWMSTRQPMPPPWPTVSQLPRCSA